MKKFIISVCSSIFTLIILSFGFSMILSIFHYKNGFVLNNIIIQLISILIFFISGLVFGLVNKKQGLIGSIVFVLVYLIFTLVFDLVTKSNNKENYYFLYVIGKCIAYSIGSVLSVNFKTK